MRKTLSVLLIISTMVWLFPIFSLETGEEPKTYKIHAMQNYSNRANEKTRSTKPDIYVELNPVNSIQL